MTDTEQNRELVTQFWKDLYERDFDAVGELLHRRSRITPTCARRKRARSDPEKVVARLKLGLEPLAGYEHELKHIVADGDMVVTEHAELWKWHTGESVLLPFVSVHELRDGKIVRWHDYWDMQTLMNAAPTWWVEHIMVGY